MNFYKRHLGDYAKDTPHLSMVEHGAYGLLLDYCYATERSLPADMETIFRVCRAISKVEQQAVRVIAEAFFPIGEDGLRHNKRCEQELAKANRQREINRETGKLGGRPKQTEQVTESVIGNKTESVIFQEPNDNPSQTPDSRQRKNTPLPPSADASGVSVSQALNGHDPIKPRRKRRRTEELPLPDAWEPDAQAMEWTQKRIVEHRLSDAWAWEQLDAMRDYARQHPAWQHADWNATWRNWVRRKLDDMARH